MLNTKRIQLRRLERTDLERCHEWLSVPEVLSGIGVFGPRSIAEQEQWYEGIAASRTNIIFAICLAEDGTHIGNSSIFDVDHINSNAALTTFIADEGHRSLGYGTDVLGLMCEYAFGYLNLHRIYGKMINPISAHVLENLGFKEEGVLREHAFRDGAYVDKVMYGVLRSEFSWIPERD